MTNQPTLPSPEVYKCYDIETKVGLMDIEAFGDYQNNLAICTNFDPNIETQTPIFTINSKDIADLEKAVQDGKIDSFRAMMYLGYVGIEGNAMKEASKLTLEMVGRTFAEARAQRIPLVEWDKSKFTPKLHRQGFTKLHITGNISALAYDGEFTKLQYKSYYRNLFYEYCSDHEISRVMVQQPFDNTPLQYYKDGQYVEIDQSNYIRFLAEKGLFSLGNLQDLSKLPELKLLARETIEAGVDAALKINTPLETQKNMQVQNRLIQFRTSSKSGGCATRIQYRGKEIGIENRIGIGDGEWKNHHDDLRYNITAPLVNLREPKFREAIVNTLMDCFVGGYPVDVKLTSTDDKDLVPRGRLLFYVDHHMAAFLTQRLAHYLNAEPKLSEKSLNLPQQLRRLQLFEIPSYEIYLRGSEQNDKALNSPNLVQNAKTWLSKFIKKK